MKINKYNFKHADEYCHICKTSEWSLFDEHRGEVYCAKCGLVLRSPTRKSVVEILEEARRKELFIRGLWKQKRKK